jgi:hypothetical protein
MEQTMARGTTRAHVVIPEELLREVDTLVGPRRRSEFFVDAAREKIARERLRIAAHDLAGSLKDEDTPDWDTPEATSAWVHSLRAENDEGVSSPDHRG